MLEAIRSYTWNAAYSVYHETRKGSLEVGKLADLAIIDAAFLSVPVAEISQQEIYMTISNGEIVYRK
ncbi:amidohydrolase family protein [Aliamphritea spongicola]|nr:amidohydrolase family protein [Aliamphritea spongicola]